MALISGALPPNTCYGTPQQLVDLFAQYLSLPGQNLILEESALSPTLSNNVTAPALGVACTFAVNVAGASVNDVVVVNPSQPIPECVVDGYVSGSNVVTVRVMPVKAQAVSIPNRNYFIKVLKYSIS
jgi:hypothetical protein